MKTFLRGLWMLRWVFAFLLSFVVVDRFAAWTVDNHHFSWLVVMLVGMLLAIVYCVGKLGEE